VRVNRTIQEEEVNMIYEKAMKKRKQDAEIDAKYQSSEIESKLNDAFISVTELILSDFEGKGGLHFSPSKSPRITELANWDVSVNDKPIGRIWFDSTDFFHEIKFGLESNATGEMKRGNGFNSLVEKLTDYCL
jgi:hypothetical protein